MWHLVCFPRRRLNSSKSAILVFNSWPIRQTFAAGSSYLFGHSRQGRTVLALGAGWGDWLDISLSLSLSLSLWKTARYRFKYCFKRSLIPEKNNQPFVKRGNNMEILVFQSWRRNTSKKLTGNSSNLYEQLLSIHVDWERMGEREILKLLPLTVYPLAIRQVFEETWPRLSIILNHNHHNIELA